MSLEIEKNTVMTSKIVPLVYRVPESIDEDAGPEFPIGTVLGVRLCKEEGTTRETRVTNLYYVLGVFEDEEHIDVLEEDENLFDSRINDQVFRRIENFSDISDFEPTKIGAFIGGAIQIPTRVIDKYDKLLGI